MTISKIVNTTTTMIVHYLLGLWVGLHEGYKLMSFRVLTWLHKGLYASVSRSAEATLDDLDDSCAEIGRTERIHERVQPGVDTPARTRPCTDLQRSTLAGPDSRQRRSGTETNRRRRPARCYDRVMNAFRRLFDGPLPSDFFFPFVVSSSGLRLGCPSPGDFPPSSFVDPGLRYSVFLSSSTFPHATRRAPTAPCDPTSFFSPVS